MRLAAHGLALDVPVGWDARIYCRTESPEMAPNVTPAGAVPVGGYTAPVMHVANFALPEGRGDYGSGAVETMKSSSVFIAMLEFGRESVGTPLFEHHGIPTLRASDISASTLQRPMGTLGGSQRFFTANGRAFCLYVVVGAVSRRSALVSAANLVIGRITIT